MNRRSDSAVEPDTKQVATKTRNVTTTPRPAMFSSTLRTKPEAELPIAARPARGLSLGGSLRGTCERAMAYRALAASHPGTCDSNSLRIDSDFQGWEAYP